jgi:hypothetical protein
MSTVPEVIISVLASAVATLATASALVNIAMHAYMRQVPYPSFPGQEIHGPRWLGLIVPGSIVGSLVLSPLLFALCYHLLSRKARPASPTDGTQP